MDPATDNAPTQVWTLEQIAAHGDKCDLRRRVDKLEGSQGEQWSAINTNTTNISVVKAQFAVIMALLLAVVGMLIGIYLKT